MLLVFQHVSSVKFNKSTAAKTKKTFPEMFLYCSVRTAGMSLSLPSHKITRCLLLDVYQSPLLMLVRTGKPTKEMMYNTFSVPVGSVHTFINGVS